MEPNFTIKVFENDNQTEPFTDWFLALDSTTRKRIFVRLARLQAGNFGDCKQIDNDLFELRCFFGSGYRVYFGKEYERTVILLCGGDKGSQVKDIHNAKQYWNKHNEKKNIKS